MYLSNATDIDDILEFGVKPGLEFLELAFDERADGDEEKAAWFELEGMSKFKLVGKRLEVIMQKQMKDAREDPSYTAPPRELLSEEERQFRQAMCHKPGFAKLLVQCGRLGLDPTSLIEKLRQEWRAEQNSTDN